MALEKKIMPTPYKIQGWHLDVLSRCRFPIGFLLHDHSMDRCIRIAARVNTHLMARGAHHKLAEVARVIWPDDFRNL